MSQDLPMDPGEEPPEPPEAWLSRLQWGLILGYRKTLSPYLGQHCRFRPSCSVYALQALGKYGLLKANRLILWRILRCNPLCEGGYDPP